MLFWMRWLARWPLSSLHALGACLGWLAYALSASYRQRLRTNAGLAGLGRVEMRASVAEAGKMVMEAPWLWLRPVDRPLSPWLRWDGDALIEAGLQGAHGLVILTPHLGSFEVCAQAYAERWGEQRPATVMYRPARKAALRRLEETARARPGLHTAPATLAGVRQMLRALKRGESVGLLPDQVPPEGMGVWATFYGQPAYTMTLAARLARQGGAPLLLMWGERLGGGQGWCVHVRPGPVLPPPPAGAGEEEAWSLEAATAVNRAMEQLIAECPEQYLWGYHRYKTPRRETLG
jgi:KDO2-lipid IV(A) lauroyltransferase